MIAVWGLWAAPNAWADAAPPAPRAAVSIYTDAGAFVADGLAAGVDAFDELGFEGLEPNTAIGDAYAERGLRFEPADVLTASPSVAGVSPRGELAALLAGGAQTRLIFTEPQRYLGFYLIDVKSDVSVEALLGGVLLNSFELEAAGEGVPGGVFRGVRLWIAVDELRVSAAQGDDVGIDDLHFAPYDGDNDGIAQSEGDCNDADDSVYPGAAETPYDGVDQDCDGADLLDADGDGQTPLAYGGADCDDTDGDTYTGAPELPDGKDNNCDGRIDDGTVNADDDQDGYSEAEGDCDDADGDRSPGVEEIPYDGIDQDCSGADLTDVDGDGYDAEIVGGDDCDDTIDNIHPGAEEHCGDRVDDDCDGIAAPCPTSTPVLSTATLTASPSQSPSPTGTPTPSPSPSAVGTLEPSATPPGSVPPSEPGRSPSPTQAPTTPPPTSSLEPTPSSPDDVSRQGGGCGCGDDGPSGAALWGGWVFVVGRRRKRRTG